MSSRARTPNSDRKARTPNSYLRVIALTAASAVVILALFLIVAVIEPGGASSWEAYAAPIALTLGIGVSLAGAMVAIKLAEVAVQITDRQAFIDSAHLVKDKRSEILEVYRPLANSLNDFFASSRALRVRIVRELRSSHIGPKHLQEYHQAINQDLDHSATQLHCFLADKEGDLLFQKYVESARAFVECMKKTSENALALDSWQWKMEMLQEAGRLPTYKLDAPGSKTTLQVVNITNLERLLLLINVPRITRAEFVSDVLWSLCDNADDTIPAEDFKCKMALRHLRTHHLAKSDIEFAGMVIRRGHRVLNRSFYGYDSRLSWDSAKFKNCAPSSQDEKDYLSVVERDQHQKVVKVYHYGPLLIQLACIALPSSSEGEFSMSSYMSKILVDAYGGNKDDPVARALDVPSSVPSPRSLLNPPRRIRPTYMSVYLGDHPPKAGEPSAEHQ